MSVMLLIEIIFLSLSSHRPQHIVKKSLENWGSGKVSCQQICSLDYMKSINFLPP